MPTYEFRCTGCGESFEVVCSFAEREARAVCPACGGREVVQVFGAIHVPGRGPEFNPGYFVRPKGKDAKPVWVEPRR